MKRVFIDNSISGILTNQKNLNNRDNNPIGNLRLSLNDTNNPRTSMTFTGQAGAEAQTSINSNLGGQQNNPIESGENERNLQIKKELQNFLSEDANQLNFSNN